MSVDGYQNSLIRIDLTSESITEESLPEEEILRKYVGCFGLGLHLFDEEVQPGIDPLGPNNPLIFLTGPLTGVPEVPSPNNTTITTLNAETKRTVGRSHSHGWFGPRLKFAGYDGFIVEGQATDPVWLDIRDDGVELRDAQPFWGMDTHETEEAIQEALDEDSASVAAIGPAGENLAAGAGIWNDKNHSFAHSGVGTVAGSKKLKAISVRGDQPVQVQDKDLLREATKRWTKNATSEGLAPIVGNGGVPKDEYEGVRELVGICSKNMTSNVLDGFGDAMAAQEIDSQPCYGCPVGCSYDVTITEGPHEGYTATLGGGGENMEGAASMVGVSEVGSVFYLTDLNDRLGFESSTSGAALGVAFEAFAKGFIDESDTGGLDLSWGNAEAAETLLKQMAKREGFGEVLADGPVRAAQRLGIPDAAVHIKGAGMNLHDWRRGWGVLLGQIVGGGSGWPAPGADTWTPEPDVGYEERTDQLDPSTKPEEVAKTAPKKYWEDCQGTCWFTTWGVPKVLEDSAQATAAVTGWDDFNFDEALEVGERVVTLERVVNMKHGLTVEDDLDVPPKIKEPMPDGPAEGVAAGRYIEGWVRDYYELMGWNPETGVPTSDTLRRLDIPESHLQEVM